MPGITLSGVDGENKDMKYDSKLDHYQNLRA
jgi:hypothetical protein